MSQLVRLEGKHSTQNAHCAMVERMTGMASHETKMEKGVIQGELRRQLSISAPLWSACSTGCTTLVWNGRLTKEQGAGVEGEEGGERDAVGDLDDRDVPPATWADTGQMGPR